MVDFPNNEEQVTPVTQNAPVPTAPLVSNVPVIPTITPIEEAGPVVDASRVGIQG